MGFRLYCNRYGHFRDPIVCSVVCQYRVRCHDFALYYDAHRTDVDSSVVEYYAKQNRTARNERDALATTFAFPIEIRKLINLEVKREMPISSYIWIDKEGIAELLSLEEIIKRAEKGLQPKSIYKVAQEMELRFQLVPRKRIEKSKRIVATNEERAAARRKRSEPAEMFDAPKLEIVPEPEISTAVRRPRGRAAKASGE